MPRVEGEEGEGVDYDSEDDEADWLYSQTHPPNHPGSRRGSIAERRQSTASNVMDASSDRIQQGIAADIDNDDDDDSYEEEDEMDLGPSFSKEDQVKAMVFLDQWLAWESSIEETIEVLEKDGWF